MAFSVSSLFKTAQQADVNQPVSSVQLVLGNYFSSSGYGTTVASNGDDGSGNYPASGAIDGDRTELNVGAASGADNDAGKSSWRSAAAVSGGSPGILTFTLSQSRTLNRIKIYHLSTNYLASYNLQYFDGVTWQTFAATSDIVTGSQVSITTNHQIDVVDFSDIAATQWRLNVFGSQASVADVVEIEAYRLLDITDRVKSVRIGRHRDYKLANPMASTIMLDCINADRFFSINHTPTADEVADGFVNSELRPGLGLIVALGFNTGSGSPEKVTCFTGEIDRITIRPGTRDAAMEGRDQSKRLINKIDACKLKAGNDLAQNIQYILNRANFSTFEMALDTTGIIVDYFFTEQQAILDTVRDLVQAAGDALFYFTETGVATFKFYTQNVQNDHLYTSDTDFSAGTEVNLATLGAYADTLSVPVLFGPTLASGSLSGDAAINGSNVTLPSSTAYTGDSFALGGGSLTVFYNNTSGSSIPTQTMFQPFTVPRDGTISSITIGGWSNSSSTVKVKILSDSGGTPNPFGVIYASADLPATQLTPVTVNPGVHITAQKIWIGLQNNGGSGFDHVQLAPATVATQATLLPAATFPNLGVFDATVFAGSHINPLGMCSSFSFTYDAVSKSGEWDSPVHDCGSTTFSNPLTVTLTGTYPSPATSTLFLEGSADGSTFDVTYNVVKLNGSQTFTVTQRRYWRMRITLSASDNVNVPSVNAPVLSWVTSSSWTSPTLDTGANTLSYGSLTDTRVLSSGTITYYTRSSADGISWDAYIQIGDSGTILSTTRRYLQTQVLMTLSGVGATCQILDITVNWTSGGASPKYPVTDPITFAFDSSLLDVQQELADNLGGDTSILNDIFVQAEPVVKGGTDADTVWQGTVGTPPTAISAGTPLSVTIGQTITVAPVISGGMDTSRMTGANPPALTITFAAGGAGSWVCASIHPTLPVFTITITGTGNITDMRIIGKTFSNATYLQIQNSKDLASIAKYGDRQASISNPWVVSTGVASTVATSVLASFKDPTTYIPQSTVSCAWSVQIGDRVTVSDTNLDLSADYIIVGIDHTLSTDIQSAQAQTGLVLLKVPDGL